MTKLNTKDQSLDEFAQMMKRDWNQRAEENAKWFINTVKLDQSEDEFDATGATEMNHSILPELVLLTQGRDPGNLRFLEIGCGIGRMTKHLARIFGEIHATDVSGEMIEQARERLREFPNVRCHETSGIDLAALPSNYFDIAFSAYVFQHVPDKAVIRSNICDAYRAVKPGGVLKLHTNGVEAQAYASADKDTWAGATFTESEMRELARQLGAQLISLYGARTMYCWTMMRKPLGSSRDSVGGAPRIEFCARADDPNIKTIPTDGTDAWLSIIASGLNREIADANNLQVIINDQVIVPRYVGRVRPHFETALDQHLTNLTYIEAGIPPTIGGGLAQIQVKLEGGEISNVWEVLMEEPGPMPPMIVTVRNGDDYGTDIHARGPKSSLRLFVEYLNETANCNNVRLKLGDLIIAPSFVGFVTDIAGFRVDAQLPSNTVAGNIELTLLFNSAASEPVALRVED